VDVISLLGSAPGRLVAASFSDVGPDPDAALAAAGCDRLVCLVTIQEMHQRFPDMERWVAEAGPRVLHAPIPDGGTIDDDSLAAVVRSLATDLEEGKGLLLQCGGGMGRVGVVAILVLVALGFELDEASEHVRRSRGGAGPDNAEQQAQINRLAPLLGFG
jgi:protein-tyrosine phosphatase